MFLVKFRLSYSYLIIKKLMNDIIIDNLKSIQLMQTNFKKICLYSSSEM